MKYGTKVVFVDYAQRLRDKDGDSEYLRVSRISNNLARIARELRVCIVSAAQINRRGAQAKERTTQPVPYPLAPPAALRFACPPETWQVIQGRLICNAHTLTVEVV